MGAKVTKCRCGGWWVGTAHYSLIDEATANRIAARAPTPPTDGDGK